MHGCWCAMRNQHGLVASHDSSECTQRSVGKEWKGETERQPYYECLGEMGETSDETLVATLLRSALAGFADPSEASLLAPRN